MLVDCFPAFMINESNLRRPTRWDSPLTMLQELLRVGVGGYADCADRLSSPVILEIGRWIGTPVAQTVSSFDCMRQKTTEQETPLIFDKYINLSILHALGHTPLHLLHWLYIPSGLTI